MTPLRVSATAVTALTAVALLAGCGTTSDAVGESADDAQTGQAVVVQDADGEDVELPNGAASEIVALEWGQAEIVESLGLSLVGLSDVEGYESWVGSSMPLSGEPADVGTRSEPSVEAIAEIEPDLIVGVPRSVPDEVREQLERVAPVLLLTPAEASDPLGNVENTVTTLATATGREDEGRALIDELDATIADNAAAIADAGLDGTPVVFTSPYADGSNVSIRMHGPGSAPQAVMSAMGLEIAWDDDEGDEGYDLTYTDIEGLTALPDDGWFLFWANADSEDPVETHLSGNAVWDSLPFVEDRRVAGVADGIWVYGGPASLMDFSDDVTATLTAG
ncbi:ABC transporter substrate-binding protein [Microbacterium halotolerans]|uniref:ABC transporter substrate-binding protein n=1 Tax=Microbacterium halotolerans TaxID=246613 RepID=UPI000E6AD830|nr:ABC transporter substrate-binding protein [Microbacterium halotolerans]